MRVVDLPVNAGASWVADAWRMFIGQPFAWLALVAAWVLFTLVLSMVPWIGGPIANILQPALFAGMILAARDQDLGKPIQLPHLFAGFQTSGRSLVQFGCIVLLARTTVLIVFSLLGINEGFKDVDTPEELIKAIKDIVDNKLILLIAMLCVLALIEGLFWFAPAVIAHQPMSAKDAIKWSFYAFVANAVPMTLFGVLLMSMLFVALLPMGIGLFIYGPLYVICFYTSFKSAFQASATPTASPTTES
jgi:uncharacterized membrane protein